MWIDETGGMDTPGSPGAPGEIDVTVDGQEYTAAANFDLNHGGVDDTIRMDNPDGTITEYTDTDHDGHADHYLHLDAQGHILQSARFDEATGDWVSTAAGHSTEHPDTQTSSNGAMTADTEAGEVNVGPATVDSDQDGRNDTAVVEDNQGNTRLYTDTDGDGKADVETIITPDGASHTYHHTGPGQWSEVRVASGVWGDDPTNDQAWGGGRQHTVNGVAKTDSTTGHWIEQS